MVCSSTTTRFKKISMWNSKGIFAKVEQSSEVWVGMKGACQKTSEMAGCYRIALNSSSQVFLSELCHVHKVTPKIQQTILAGTTGSVSPSWN